MTRWRRCPTRWTISGKFRPPVRLLNHGGIFLALGGGGARGLAHLGILLGLQKNGIQVAGICGTSMGALVGAAFALNPNAARLIEHFSEHINSKQFNRTRYAFMREVTRRNRDGSGVGFKNQLKRGLLLGRSYATGSVVPFQEFQEEVCALLPNKSFKATQIPFFAVSVDLTAGVEVVFNRGWLRSAVMASAAIPGFFPAVRKGDTVYVDGGWMNKTPASPLVAFGAERVLAVKASDEELPSKVPKRGTSVMRLAEIAAQRRLHELQLAAADLIWSPDLSTLHVMDFHRLDDAVAIGLAHAEEHIAEAKALAAKSNRRSWVSALIQRLRPPRKPNRSPGFEVRGIWDIEAMEEA